MQTFLPYPEFKLTAMCLDPKRLGNQVYRECKTLINGGWDNHPVSKMWRGYNAALAMYSVACLDELKRRGRNYPEHYRFFRKFLPRDLSEVQYPEWLGDQRIHSSHRAALLYKDYNWYSVYGWVEEPAIPNYKGSLPYFWPVE